MNNLGERLYNLRTSCEMSQGDLAEKLDVSRQTISKWENNMSIPELDKIISLSNLFGVSVDYIVKGEGGISVQTPERIIEEAVGESMTDKAPVRMITVDPTKKFIAGLSVAIGILNLIHLIFEVVNGISLFTISPDLLSQIESMPEFILSKMISLLFSIALFMNKEKFIAAILIMKAGVSLLPLLTIFSGEFMLTTVSVILGMIASVLVAAGYITAKKNNAKIYFASIVSMRILAFILVLISSYLNYTEHFNSNFFGEILSVISMTSWAWVVLFIDIAVAVIVYRKTNPKPTYEVSENAYSHNGDMYVGMVKHILLTLFTFGIYDCCWVYKTTENLNIGGINEIQSGTKKLLLCIFVPFYRIYWFYAQSKRLENLMREKDVNISDFAVVTLILAVFVPVVAASAFLQLKINEYAQINID